MSNDDIRLSAASGGVEQLKDGVAKQLDRIEDVTAQLNELAVIINNFVLQTLQVVSNNDDVSAVNEQLVNSMIQLRDFVNNRPTEVRNTVQKLEQKLDAYEQCLLILAEAAKIDLAEAKIDSGEPPVDDEDIEPEKKRRISESTNTDGEYIHRRKPGERPEKLRDIRKVEADITAQKNSEEDI